MSKTQRPRPEWHAELQRGELDRGQRYAGAAGWQVHFWRSRRGSSQRPLSLLTWTLTRSKRKPTAAAAAAVAAAAAAVAAVAAAAAAAAAVKAPPGARLLLGRTRAEALTTRRAITSSPQTVLKKSLCLKPKPVRELRERLPRVQRCWGPVWQVGEWRRGETGVCPPPHAGWRACNVGSVSAQEAHRARTSAIDRRAGAPPAASPVRLACGARRWPTNRPRTARLLHHACGQPIIGVRGPAQEE